MHNLPAHHHAIAAFEARRAELERVAALDIAIGRTLAAAAAGEAVLARVRGMEPFGHLELVGTVTTTVTITSRTLTRFERIVRKATGRHAAHMRRLADAELARQARLDGDAADGRTMRWFDGRRRQPKDGRGRFLSKAWLASAELYLPADRAWFRAPITSSQEGK